MNTVQFFNQFNPKIYTGFDVLKNHFLTKSPVKYVDNPADYSQATEFYGKSEFVFLVKHGIELTDTFPLWFKPPVNELNTAYEFPVVYKKSKNIKSWGSVVLVPADGIVLDVKRKTNMSSFYDVYCGKDSFDVFFIGTPDSKNYKKLLKIVSSARAVENIETARTLSATDMFWVVPNNVRIASDFIFDFVPNERACDYPHVFGNGELMQHDGIVLLPRSYIPSEEEIKNKTYSKKRIIREIASYPE